MQLVGGEESDLAKCKWAVALVVCGVAETTIYWINDRRCSAVEPAANTSVARAQIEAQCSPEECRLPPLIA